MKITLLAVGMYPHEVGGAQTHAYHVASSLAQLDHEVSALVFYHGGETITMAEDRDDGFLRVRLGVPTRLWRSPLNEGSEELRTRLATLAFETVSSWQPEVVHFFRHAPVQRLMLDLVDRLGVPAVFTALGFAYFCAKGPMIRSVGEVCDGHVEPYRCEACTFLHGHWVEDLPGRATSLALRWVDQTLPSVLDRHPLLRQTRQTSELWQRMCRMPLVAIAPSQVVERTFRENGFPADRMLRLTYGIPESLLARRQEKTPSARLRFTCLGKISSYKGALVAVAAARIAAAAGVSFELNIHGPLHPESDAYHRALQQAVEREPWPDGVAVRLCGRYRQEALPKIHAASDVLLFTSLWPENATIVVLEALALGTPVLAAAVEGVTEFIVEGHNGWTYPPGDEAVLARRMQELADAPEVVRAAQANTACVLTLGAMADALDGLYRTMVPLPV